MDTTTSLQDVFSVVRVTLNLPFVRHRLGRCPLVDVLMDIECGIDISLNSTECVLSGSWQQIIRAKESIEKRFGSTTIVRGSDSSSEFSEDPHKSQDMHTAHDPHISQDPHTAQDPHTSHDPHRWKDPHTSPDPRTAQDPDTAHNPHTAKDPHTAHDPHTAQVLHTSHDPRTAQDPHTAHDPHTVHDLHISPDAHTCQDPHTTQDPNTTQDAHAAQDPLTAQDVDGNNARLSGMVVSEDVFGELAIKPSPENTNVKSLERFGDSRKQSSTSPDERTEALTENNKQPDEGDGMAYTSEVIPVDVNIWQYIEGICGDQLNAIERDCGVTLTADEHGDVIMVTISSNDERHDSVARWRFVELHSDVMSRVVVEICKPLPQLYGSANLKDARKHVQDTFRDKVIIKAERGRYIFIGEVDVAKMARRQFMEWAQLPQASWTTKNQRHHGNPVRQLQTTPRPDISLEKPKDKTTRPSVPDLPQKHVDNSCNVDASQPHHPDREVSMPLSNKRIIFEFPDKPSRESELGHVQKAVCKIVSAKPQAGALLKLDNGPTTSHNADLLPAVDPVDHPESRETQHLCAQDSNCSCTPVCDHANYNDTSKSGVDRNESEASGTDVGVPDVRNELLGSEHMPDLEPISSDEESDNDSDDLNIIMVNKECAYSDTPGNDRLPENTVGICTDKTHNYDVWLRKNSATSTDANTASTRQTIGMVDAPIDDEAGSQHMASLPTGDVRVSQRDTKTADSCEGAESIRTVLNEVVGNKAPTTMDALRRAPSVERSGYNTRITTEENECITSSGKESEHHQQPLSRHSPNGNERNGSSSTEEGLEYHEKMCSSAALIRDLYSRYSCLGKLDKRSSAATDDDISPCYPDTSTRQDMIQNVLTKNDPRLTPQLQMLMDIPDGHIGIDVRDVSMKGLSMMHRDSFARGYNKGTRTAGLYNHSRGRARNVGLYEERHLDDTLSCELPGSRDEMKLNVAGCFLRHSGLYASSGATPKRLPDAQKVSAEFTLDDHDVSAIVTLKQPAGGKVSKLVDDKADLPGYQQIGVILITYDFPSGTLELIGYFFFYNEGLENIFLTTKAPSRIVTLALQYVGTFVLEGDSISNIRYAPAMFNAYLPNNWDGKRVYRRLENAFQRRILFRVQLPENPFAHGKIVWADVEHKTQSSGKNGYPDQMYPMRVSEQLDKLGVADD